MGVEEDLRKSVTEEAEANLAYNDRARSARASGDEVTAELWEHIAGEEVDHMNEFMDRLRALGAQEPSFGDYANMESMGHPMRRATYMPMRDWGKIERENPLIIGAYKEGQMTRPFPKTYGDWVDLAEDIKAKDPSIAFMVNAALGDISSETGYADEQKRWLVQKAGQLGIG